MCRIWCGSWNFESCKNIFNNLHENGVLEHSVGFSRVGDCSCIIINSGMWSMSSWKKEIGCLDFGWKLKTEIISKSRFSPNPIDIDFVVNIGGRRFKCPKVYYPPI